MHTQTFGISLGNYGKHHHHPFVKSPIHSYVHVFVLCTVNYQIFVAGVLQEESVEMILGAIVRADVWSMTQKRLIRSLRGWPGPNAQ